VDGNFADNPLKKDTSRQLFKAEFTIRLKVTEAGGFNLFMLQIIKNRRYEVPRI
jgi:hypothetical protein